MTAYPEPWLIEATDLASPKSASLAKQSESSNILDGFKSLWTKSPECIYLRPLRTLNYKAFTDKEHTFCEHFQEFWLW